MVEDVRRALEAKEPPGRSRSFMARGHMSDLEERLRSTLEYRPAVERWMIALVVNPGAAWRSAPRQLDFVRSWVRGRMGELQRALQPYRNLLGATTPMSGLWHSSFRPGSFCVACGGD